MRTHLHQFLLKLEDLRYARVLRESRGLDLEEAFVCVCVRMCVRVLQIPQQIWAASGRWGPRGG